jgi:hypothetical protein
MSLHSLLFSTILSCLWSAPTLAGDRVGTDDGTSRPLANPLAAQSLQHISAIRERPLFAATRHPPPAAAAPIVREAEAPPPPPPPNIVLFGIVRDDSSKRAIVRTATDKLVQLGLGDEIGGWAVSDIEARLIVLSLDNRSATFTLFKAHGASQSAKTAAVSMPEKRQLNRPH